MRKWGGESQMSDKEKEMVGLMKSPVSDSQNKNMLYSYCDEEQVKGYGINIVTKTRA